MPSFKKSLGEITIKTPEPAFRNYIEAELLNIKSWNPNLIFQYGNKFKCISKTQGVIWVIELLKTGIIVTSEEPIVYLRKGVKIFMGSSRMEIS